MNRSFLVCRLQGWFWKAQALCTHPLSSQHSGFHQPAGSPLVTCWLLQLQASYSHMYHLMQEGRRMVPKDPYLAFEHPRNFRVHGSLHPQGSVYCYPNSKESRMAAGKATSMVHHTQIKGSRSRGIQIPGCKPVKEAGDICTEDV